ncbi:MAG TPA: DUF5320 domain-containing protein [Defluviitoga sp.]|nr:DUF5320 domain-containing protein [Defluviitoga sp.]HOP24577.1 DUF5320 domain-containing protein [Defluviitoga sp.]HPZ29501.1 DUF5320 domain-containing protein [Defluviitoga sp.]HQD63307.1 DUF5320 domain-containing protein [Defluviitoga sp.]
MPNLDGTGPWGLGPMTGRGYGWCGRGYGGGYRHRHRHGYRHGWGPGPRGYGRWAGAYDYPASSLRDDRALLELKRQYLQEELNYIEKILKETGSTGKEE